MCKCAKSVQLCLTLCDPMDCSASQLNRWLFHTCSIFSGFCSRCSLYSYLICRGFLCIQIQHTTEHEPDTTSELLLSEVYVYSLKEKQLNAQKIYLKKSHTPTFHSSSIHLQPRGGICWKVAWNNINTGRDMQNICWQLMVSAFNK